MEPGGRCPTCGGELIQKQPWRLWLVATVMLAVCTVFFHYVHAFRFVGFILGLTGCYLAAWALIGKARWCRNCKRFPIG